jgi:hypothetical protein
MGGSPPLFTGVRRSDRWTALRGAPPCDILREVLLYCRESAKWRLDRSNARSRMMKNFCEMSVDGLKFVDSIVKLASFCRGERNGSRRTECNWGAKKDETMFRGRSRSFLYQKRSDQIPRATARRGHRGIRLLLHPECMDRILGCGPAGLQSHASVQNPMISRNLKHWKGFDNFKGAQIAIGTGKRQRELDERP